MSNLSQSRIIIYVTVNMKKDTNNDIDNEQPETIDEHFNLITSDKSLVECEFIKMSPEDLPEWFDEELFKQGQDYYEKNLLSFNTSHLIGLLGVFLIPSINKILVLTKQSSTPCLAFRRYFQTWLHIYNLLTCDPKDAKSKFYKSLNTVRWKHFATSARLKKNKKDEMLQKDMVLTQFAFIGYILMKPELLSITNKITERQGINHFWRVVGYMLGIPNRLNLCRKNEYETMQLCKKILSEIHSKQLSEPNPDFSQITNDVLEGLKCVDPLLNLDVFFVYFYEIHGSKYKKQLSFYSKSILMYRKINFYLIGLPIIGCIVRSFWNIYIQVILTIFEKYPVIAWMKFGKENSDVKVFPHSGF